MLKEYSTEKVIAQLFDSQPDAVVWFLPLFFDDASEQIIDFQTQYANQAASRILGVASASVIGVRLLSNKLMDTTSTKIIFSQCCEVWKSGMPMEYTYYSPGLDRYFNVQRSKVEGGILSITRDRTREVKTEVNKQEQEKIYRQILDSTADGIMLLKAMRNKENLVTDFLITHCNKRGLEIGRFSKDTVGKSLLTVLPHLKDSDQFSLHQQVVTTGQPIRFETPFHTPKGEPYGWFIVSLTKLGDNVISSFVDVSEKKLDERKILEQKQLLNNILDASLSAVYTCEAVRNEEGSIIDFRFIQINQKFKELSVRPGFDVIGKKLLEEFPATANTNTVEKLVKVVETGQPERFEVHYKSDTDEGWYDTSAVKMGDNGVVVTFINVTEQKRAIHEIEQQRDLLQKLLRHSPSSIAIIEAIRNNDGEVIDFRTVLFNDQATKFTGLSREVLATKTNVEIDPDFYNSLAHRMLAETLKTGDACYTNHRLPTGKWIEGAASKMDDDHLICITTDVTSQKQIEEQMTSLLQDLQRSNENLEEFTSAASHDLKEPIRKVQYFTEKLKLTLEQKLSGEERRLISRIETAATRMKILVDDLLEYSHVNNAGYELETIDLNEKINLVLHELDLQITEKNASVEFDHLPSVIGNGLQLQQLFQNLIGNAIKYHKPNEKPLVQIFANFVTGESFAGVVPKDDRPKKFHLIEVKDNGIGFEPQDADRIFHVFTRLHGNNEYSGTGVGLAIVKKVIENHNGYIWAEGETGKGASFKLLLPVESE